MIDSEQTELKQSMRNESVLFRFTYETGYNKLTFLILALNLRMENFTLSYMWKIHTMPSAYSMALLKITFTIANYLVLTRGTLETNVKLLKKLKTNTRA